MPHTMYFTSDSNTITKINQVPYQTIEYNDNGMFTAKLMNDTSIEIFIDNGATPSILPLRTYNKFPILHTYPKTESNTPIHTGGGLITSHFWLEIPLKLQHQTIQIKALVCDLEIPYDLIARSFILHLDRVVLSVSYCFLQLCQRSLFLWLCINIYLVTLGNVVRVCPRIVQGLTFLSA